MPDHAEKVHDRILEAPAPRDIDWASFVNMWERYAEDVKKEDNAIAVTYNGHREVYHRPHHDEPVGIEQIEHTRDLFRYPAVLKGRGVMHVLTLTLDDFHLVEFDLDATDTDVVGHHHGHADDGRLRHLRVVERHAGNGEENDLKGYFQQVAKAVGEEFGDNEFVILGHGKGNSNAADDFLDWAQKHDPQLKAHVRGVGRVEISGATDPEIEAAALKLIKE